MGNNTICWYWLWTDTTETRYIHRSYNRIQNILKDYEIFSFLLSYLNRESNISASRYYSPTLQKKIKKIDKKIDTFKSDVIFIVCRD